MAKSILLVFAVCSFVTNARADGSSETYFDALAGNGATAPTDLIYREPSSVVRKTASITNAHETPPAQIKQSPQYQAYINAVKGGDAIQIKATGHALAAMLSQP